MKTYLITGGLGFIGYNYINKIIDDKNNFIINLDKNTYVSNTDENLGKKNYKFIKGDICNKKLVEKIFKKYSIDYVINFAAESHVSKCFKNSELFYKSNVLGVLNLLSICKKYWESDYSNHRFLQISTDEVYGEGQDEKFETSILNPQTPYASSKASAELLVNSFVKSYNFPALITRSTNNFGIFQYPEKLIPLFFILAYKNLTLPLAFPNHIRDWLFVDDNINGINLVLEKGKVGEVYNISANNLKTNAEMVNIIIKFIKTNINTNYEPNFNNNINNRIKDDNCYNINCDKIKNLGFKTTNFEENFYKTLNFYKNNINYLIQQFNKNK